jgi:hypothetical protein
MSDDTHKWECAECEFSNDVRITACQRCRTPRPDIKADKETALKHGFCSFVSTRTGRQCPLPGDISLFISKKPKFYCAGHYRTNNIIEAEQAYDDAVAHCDEIISAIKQSFHNDPTGYIERNARKKVQDKEDDFDKFSEF